MTVELLRDRFAQHARDYCGRSPLYGEICSAAARDDATLELMLAAPEHQRRPTLLQAAIHDLLLSGADHALAAHFPTVAEGRAPNGRPGPLAMRFCREYRDELSQRLATRSTQTNEVNRAVALLPALAAAAPRDRPLRLVELGASAGLNLLADRFTYRYLSAAGGPGTAVGPAEGATPGSPAAAARGATPATTVGSSRGASPRHGVVCECTVSGGLPPLHAPPAFAERIGVDLEPVDLDDPAARRWLLACVWPDEPDRVARLRAAIALARVHRPTVVRGDALAALPVLVRGEAHPVVWHSWVLAYWTVAAQRELAAAVDALGARRDLTWIYLEQPSETPGLPTPAVSGARHDRADCALVAIRYRAGERTVRRLADVHDHGHRMHWLAPQR